MIALLLSCLGFRECLFKNPFNPFLKIDMLPLTSAAANDLKIFLSHLQKLRIWFLPVFLFSFVGFLFVSLYILEFYMYFKTSNCISLRAKEQTLFYRSVCLLVDSLRVDIKIKISILLLYKWLVRKLCYWGNQLEEW
jgi:hypothetical protein